MPISGCSRRLLMVAVLGGASALRADEPLRIETYVEIVLRSHPAMQAARALDESAAAEKLGARLLADPTLEVSVGRGRSTADPSERGTETSFALSQTIPWFPARAAAIDAADHAAQARRAEASASRWSLAIDARLAFYRVVEARALVEVASATEADARSLLDLVSRRASLGETREVDRIKARVEWLKQQREMRVAEREVDAAEATLRTLAASPLSQPLLLSGELSRPLDAMNVLREATPGRRRREPPRSSRARTGRASRTSASRFSARRKWTVRRSAPRSASCCPSGTRVEAISPEPAPSRCSARPMSIASA
jgi:outer membrane protein TolC